MNYAPILVLQMQRMGDMVLSFPTFMRLQKAYPLHPIWVVGEKTFVEPLRSLSSPFSSQITYFTYDALPDLRKISFFCVLNLSHRQEAAALAGSLQTDQLFGQYMKSDGSLHINGIWQLYRASLTQNNRYNLFHWADLNSLDVVEKNVMQTTGFFIAKPLKAQTKQRIGLFLGASVVEKYPDAFFWALLAETLYAQGHEPILLGGDVEIELGNAVVAKASVPLNNQCGCFTISDFAEYIAGLDVLITPDTGPMHIAVLQGTPVINISMGSVNPWETGPYGQGHYVLRANLDCVSCWECNQVHVCEKCEQVATPKALCKQHFLAEQVSKIVSFLPTSSLLDKTVENELEYILEKLEIFISNKDHYGLYSLAPVCSQALLQKLHIYKQNKQKASAATSLLHPCETNEYNARMLLAQFWQRWFACHFGYIEAFEVEQCVQNLCERAPELHAKFVFAVESTLQQVMQYSRSASSFLADFSAQWNKGSQYVHPLMGFLQMYLSNMQVDAQTRAQTGLQVGMHGTPPHGQNSKNSVRYSRIYTLEQLENVRSFL